MSWLERDALEAMGFASLGNDVLISDKASIYNCPNIHIGDHVRIDDFSVISAGAGGIRIGSYVHIAVFCSVIGAETITLSDFSGLSSRVSIYSSNDDYSGAALTNPTVPAEYANVTSKPVWVGRHVIIGSGSIILPGITLHDGVAIGALSLVTKHCAEFGIYSGHPARLVKPRKRNLLELERALLAGKTPPDA